MVKKTYVKPDIMFESFSLATDISAGCAMAARQAPMMCPVYVPEFGETIIADDGSCDTYAPEISDTICYHLPLTDISVFES